MQARGTILLVEDEPNLRKVIQRVLTASGYRVLAAGRGEEALDLAAGEPGIDLIVSDIRLPDMYGRRLAERLGETRSEAGGKPHLPVLYISGHPAETATGTPLAEHERFLHKPFEIEDLIKVVRHLLGDVVGSGRLTTG